MAPRRASSGRQRLRFGAVFIALGFEEAVVPALWGRKTFERKAATPEIMDQMWTFQDKGSREVCLIPEVTALFQEMVQCGEIRDEKKIFYVARCYRYERPQTGRYREFIQLGVEILNPRNGPQAACLEALDIAKKALAELGLPAGDLAWDTLASRGLGYYLNGQGFEARSMKLQAQSQLVGGGSYAEGAGFAIGLERLLLAKNQA